MQTETADDYETLADAIDELANRLRGADSVAQDCPVLSELFHEVRTSRRHSREGKYVALLDYSEGDGWDCRSVSFLASGTYYRDSGAELSVSFKPMTFLSVDEFAQHTAASLKRDARANRQTAGNIRESKKMKQQMQKQEGH